MRCSIVRNCSNDAAYYIREVSDTGLGVELEEGVFVEPAPGIIAFCCLTHMEAALNQGVPPECFWSLPSKEVPEPRTEGTE